MKRVILATVAAGALGAVLGGAFESHKLKPLIQYSHLDGRMETIASQAAQLESVETVVLGDSIVERAVIPSLCGGSVLNAGIGGARTHELDAAMLGPLRAKRIIISVGVNDTVQGDRFDIDGLQASYSHLVEAAERRAPVTVALIGPVADAGPLGAAHYSRERIDQMNAFIRRIAAARHLGLIDTQTIMGLQGRLPPESTADGVHLTASGYRTWLTGLNQVCAPAAGSTSPVSGGAPRP